MSVASHAKPNLSHGSKRLMRLLFRAAVCATLSGCGGGDAPADGATPSAEAAAFSAKIALANAALAAQSPPAIAAPPPPSPSPAPALAPVGPPSPAAVPPQPPASVPPSQAQRPPSELAITRSVVISGLQVPTDLAFTPDGALLFAERDRGLSVRKPDGRTIALFAPSDLLTGEGRGIWSVAVDRDFERNRFVYVLMVTKQRANPEARLVRIVLDAKLGSASSRTDIVTGIAVADARTAPSAKLPFNPTGRVRQGPDGFIYVATGDALSGSAPQSRSELAGKVLRVDRNGAPAPGNPIQPDFDARVFGYGVRDPRGLGFHPTTGQLFVAEAGVIKGGDEITPFAAGGNGGWDPACKQGGGYCGGGDASAPMTDAAKFPAALRPAWSYGQPHGLSGAAFLRGGAWRNMQGALAVSFSSGRRVDVLHMTPGGQVYASTPLFVDMRTRFAGAAEGPRGNLYLMTEGQPGGDEIWRVEPK